MNFSAMRVLGDAKAVEVLYDPEVRAIGLRRVNPASRNACRILRHVNGKAYTMSLQRLCSYYGIDTSRTIRYAAVAEGDVLVIELDKPVGARTRRSIATS